MFDSFTFLRKIDLFANLPDTDLEQLCRDAEEVHLAAGDMLFNEGSMGGRAYVIVEGQIEIYKSADKKNVQLGIRRSGEVIGEMSILEAAPRMASGRALTASTLLAISSDNFNHMLDTSPSAARRILQTFSRRLQSTESLLRQNERMAQLGTFAAGMAHELNNPSAAVQSSTEQLKAVFQEYQRLTARLNQPDVGASPAPDLQALEERLRLQAQSPTDLDPLVQGDREARLEDWLEEMGVEDSWNLAPQLASTGLEKQDLEPFTSAAAPAQVSVLLEWAAAAYSMYRLLEEIGQAAGRISGIVNSLKSYVYLDQSPVQEVDIHASLENTLAILRYKLGKEITIKQQFDPALPPILGYGSELNQLWTNLIDNAIDALDGKGQITLRTTWREPWVVVDIADSGPGIPEEVQARLFSPFYTTKPVGKGSGLGLHISYKIVQKHDGDIKVNTRPGETHFEVWLPRDFEQARQSGTPAVPIDG